MPVRWHMVECCHRSSILYVLGYLTLMVHLAPIFKFIEEPTSEFWDTFIIKPHSKFSTITNQDSEGENTVMPFQSLTSYQQFWAIFYFDPLGHGNFTGSLDKIKSNIFWLIRRGMGIAMLASSSMSFVVLLTLSKFITKWAKKVSYQFKIPKSKGTIVTLFWCESFDMIDYMTHSTRLFVVCWYVGQMRGRLRP